MQKQGLKCVSRLLAELSDPKDVRDVLKGILTPQEQARIDLRWRIVELLVQGVSQRSIAERLGVSLCNITRGSHELKHGPRRFKAVVERAAKKKPTKGG